MSTGPGRKPLVLLGGTIRSPPFTTAGRQGVGTRLRQLQEGESPGMPASRPMPSIGRGVHKPRIRDAGHNWRIVYRVEPDRILIVEVFAKKTRAPPVPVIDACRAQLKKYDVH